MKTHESNFTTKEEANEYLETRLTELEAEYAEDGLTLEDGFTEIFLHIKQVLNEDEDVVGLSVIAGLELENTPSYMEPLARKVIEVATSKAHKTVEEIAGPLAILRLINSLFEEENND